MKITKLKNHGRSYFCRLRRPLIVSTLVTARYHNAIYSVMVENINAIYSVVRNAVNTYNRDMTTRKKMQAVAFGMNEKSIIREDRQYSDTFTKYGVTMDKRTIGDKCCDVIQSISVGMNEKDIIKEARDHYTAIHPTQKPVRLLERLLNLVLISKRR